MGRISHWTPQRWSQPARFEPGRSEPGRSQLARDSSESRDLARDGPDSRADCVFALIQWLADLTAAAERASARPVPRLDNDLALPDQLRVMIADLLVVQAPPEVYQRAAAFVDETARRL